MTLDTARRIAGLTLLSFALMTGGCDSNSSPDFRFIDAYLGTWDRFAQGANELAPQIRFGTARFQRELAKALKSADKRAPSRLVFYEVVQVGGFIAYDSELGRACERLVQTNVPVFISKTGERMYFAGDLYFWWEGHKGEFEKFPLYEEWRQREFARSTVIPMYQSSTKKP